MSERERYRSISVKTEFADAIEHFIKTNPQHGYRSISQFMEDAARKRLEEMKAKEIDQPRLEMFNHDSDGIKIFDRHLQKIIEVYFKPTGILCDFDKTDSCEHIEFALANPEIQTIIRKRRREGWKLPEV